jgi:putative oxidoreductase
MRIEEATHAVFRIGVGLLFLQHGLQKVFGMLGGFGGTPGATAPLGSLLGVAGLMELIGGALLVVGFLVRPVAAVLVLEMLVAFAKAHLPRGGWPIQNGGELALLFALAFVFLAGHGAGRASVDSWLARRRSDDRDAIAVSRRSRAA